VTQHPHRRFNPLRWLGSPQRDVNPEDAAARLREVGEG
jgi:hypothetical protein